MYLGLPMSTYTDPEMAIQPFVPVNPRERTDLYSQQELLALSTTDARNELDEMSEPNRYRKNLGKGAACYRPNLILGFLAGVCAGALLMALTAPKPAKQQRVFP